MGLSFLTPMLLGGAALIVVPLVLHLVMRRKPVKLDFPALRFLRERSVANRRRLQVNHLLLLLLPLLRHLLLLHLLPKRLLPLLMHRRHLPLLKQRSNSIYCLKKTTSRWFFFAYAITALGWGNMPNAQFAALFQVVCQHLDDLFR